MTNTFWELLDRIGPIEKAINEQGKDAGTLISGLKNTLAGTESQLTPIENMSLWGFFYREVFDYFEEKQDLQALHVACLEMIEKFTSDDESIEHNDLVAFRVEFRRAFALTAEKLIDKDLEQSLVLINKCFSIKSGIGDYLDIFQEYYGLKAKIYLKSWQAGLVTQDQAFAALSLYQRKKADHPPVDIHDPALDEVSGSDEFKNFVQNSGVGRYKKGPESETWPQALERYENALESLELEDADSCEIERLGKESVQDISELEERLGTALPASLKQLYLGHGGFNIKDDDYWESLSIYSSDQIGSFVAKIDSFWGGRPEFEEYLKPDMIKALDAQYFIFGNYHHHDNANSHLYFDRNGAFGYIYYHQDRWDDFQDELNDLLGGEYGGWSLDQLISDQVNELVESVISMKDEEDSEY